MDTLTYLLVIIFITSFISLISSEKCDKRCTWTGWSSWSECSRQCAGGTEKRSREFCCKLELSGDIEACAKDCGLIYNVMRSGFRESRGCNEHCDHGGRFIMSGYCQCPDRYRGTCCKDVVTCSRPSTVSHGSFSGSDFTFAGTVRYICDKNYNMTDPSDSSRTCSKYGYWSGSAPTCMYATSCNSSPCKNGARCINLLGDYRCDCTTGWTGKNCEVDIQPPVVHGCPNDRTIVTANLTSTQVWSEPNITDPHGTDVHVTKNYQKSAYEFPWGEFTVQYSAVKPSNGLRAECKFNISVKPYPCNMMDAPKNGIILCNGWRREYSQVCIFVCKQNYTLPPGYKADDIYVCGATGHWLPTNPVPQCISEKLFPTKQVQKFPTCTGEDDRKEMAAFYIDFLKQSAVNALCGQHEDDCKPENVDIKC